MMRPWIEPQSMGLAGASGPALIVDGPELSGTFETGGGASCHPVKFSENKIAEISEVSMSIYSSLCNGRKL